MAAGVGGVIRGRGLAPLAQIPIGVEQVTVGVSQVGVERVEELHPGAECDPEDGFRAERGLPEQAPARIASLGDEIVRLADGVLARLALEQILGLGELLVDLRQLVQDCLALRRRLLRARGRHAQSRDERRQHAEHDQRLAPAPARIPRPHAAGQRGALRDDPRPAHSVARRADPDCLEAGRAAMVLRARVSRV